MKHLFIITFIVVSLFIFTPAHAQDITLGLIGHWTFDEGSGTTAADSSGNNNTGTLTNGPTWTTGKIGNAVNFDGVDDFINVPSNPSISIPSDITTSAWIYKSSNSGNDEIVRSGSDHRFKTNGDEVEWTYAGGDDYHITSNVNLQTNRWYHVAAVFNNVANTVVIYVDGVLVLTKTENQSATLTGPLYIGKEISAASYFHGSMDDLRLYNRVLSASDIQALYSLGSGTPPPADTTAPTVSMTAPTNGLTVSGSPVTVSANASDNVGVVGVQFKLDGSNLGVEDTTSPYLITWNSTTATNGSHALTVTARDAAGNQTTSSAITVTVSNVADTQAPTIPTNLSATTISFSQINLSWTASTDNVGVTEYRVERCQGTSCTTFIQISAPSGTSYNDTGLSANTTYRYQVRAVDAAGNVSGYSSIASATTQSGGGGGIPSALGWYQILNTRIRPNCPDPLLYPELQLNEGCDAVTQDWSGGIFDEGRNRLLIFGGGHYGYAGNELYALNMNTLTMSRLNEPSRNPPTTCQEATASNNTMPDGKPTAGHTYDHLAYIQHADRMMWFGGGSVPCGSFDNATWILDLASLVWTRMNPAGPLPRPTYDVGAHYYPATQKIYLRDDFALYSYDYGANTYTKLSADQGMSNFKASFIDTKRGWYVILDMSSGSMYYYDINPGSTYARLPFSYTGDATPVNTNYIGIAYDPTTDRAVAWKNGNTAYVLDMNTHVWSAVTYVNGPAGIITGAFGRWRYVPTLNIFVSVNDIDDNAYTLRLTTSSSDTQPPTAPTTLSATAVSSSQINLSWSASTDNVGVTGYRVERCQGSSCATFAQVGTPIGTTYNDTGLSANTAYRYQVRATDAAGNLSAYSSIVSATTQQSGGSTPDADFQARCSAPGVVKCVGFDNTSEFTQAVYPNDGPYAPGGGTLAHLIRDTTNKASGAGSARFEVVSGGGENPSGSWVVGYPLVQAGQTFYVQFRQRFDSNMINNKNLFGGGGWKQIIMHSLEAGSCAALEVTMGNGGYYGFPRMYTDCGQGFLDFYSPISNDYVLEWSQPYPPDNPGTPGIDYWCLYNPALQGSTSNRCAFYLPNEWMTFYYQITVGAWGQPNSTVKAWVGYEGQPLQLVINYNNKVLNKETVAPGFNRLTLTNYDTGRCTVGPCTHPTANTWYDELIVSTQPIAAPGAITPPSLLGDLNGDRTVNNFDWNIMVSVWFTNDPIADINRDGIVNTADYYYIYTNWGKSS